MKPPRQFPYIPEEMMRALEEAFPDKAPRDLHTTQVETGALIGQQQVLDFLRHRLALQQKPERNL